MKSEVKWKDRFTKEIQFRPAYDKRDPNPSKNYGIHCMEIAFFLTGPKGTIQFVMATGMFLKPVEDWLFERQHGDRFNSFSWKGYDIGYHSPKPLYKGQREMGRDCPWLPGQTCYYDGSSLRSDPIAALFVEKGEDAVWDEMEREYVMQFEERQPAEETTEDKSV